MSALMLPCGQEIGLKWSRRDQDHLRRAQGDANVEWSSFLGLLQCQTRQPSFKNLRLFFSYLICSSPWEKMLPAPTVSLELSSDMTVVWAFGKRLGNTML